MISLLPLPNFGSAVAGFLGFMIREFMTEDFYQNTSTFPQVGTFGVSLKGLHENNRGCLDFHLMNSPQETTVGCVQITSSSWSYLTCMTACCMLFSFLARSLLDGV